MKHPTRWRRMALLVLALALVAAACGDGDDAATGDDAEDTGEETAEETAEATGGEYSVYICEPESLTPTNTNEVCGAEVLNALFTGLVDYDPGTSEPLLGDESERAVAESIESEDQQTWTITLKDGFTFHDGTPVTAQSFVDSWNYGAYGPNAQGNSYFLASVEGYEDLQCGTTDEGEADCETSPPAAEEMSGLVASDDQTLEVTLAEPFSQFPLTVGYTAFYPMPESFFEDPEAFNEAPVGNGPFQMDGEWQRNQQVNVVRYDDHPAPPNADAVEFRIYADVNTGYNDLIAGNLDVMDSLPPEQIESAQAEFGDRFIEDQSSSHTYIGIPTYDERFESIELRRAFSKAIDRQAITDAVLPQQTPAYGVVSPVVQGARENACGDNCEYDPEAASELFEQAGGWEGPLTLWFNAGAGHDIWMEAVANQLRENLGIEEIEFEQLQFAEYLGLLDNREITGPYRLGWVMDYPSPQNYLEPLFATDGSSNNSGYANPEVDDLIAEGNRAETIEEGIEFYHQAEDLILQDLPHIPMFHGRVAAAYSENVEGVIVDAFTRVNTADIQVTNS